MYEETLQCTVFIIKLKKALAILLAYRLYKNQTNKTLKTCLQRKEKWYYQKRLNMSTEYIHILKDNNKVVT